jgi:CheY-like chemotaxis protein
LIGIVAEVRIFVPMIIVYADDDPEDRELFSEALAEIFPETKLVLARHGREVISLLQNTPDLPDYIFLDINMPVMDGKDCLEKLKAMDHLRHIPIIMFTTASNKRECEKCLQLGARNYIVKSSSFQGIKDAIQSAIR